jgi:hypothetical protein
MAYRFSVEVVDNMVVGAVADNIVVAVVVDSTVVVEAVAVGAVAGAVVDILVESYSLLLFSLIPQIIIEGISIMVGG